jgi:HEAT repeat protein
MRFRLSLSAAVLAVLMLPAVVYALNAEDLLSDLNKGSPEKQLDAAMRLVDFIQFPEVVTALAAKLDDAKGDAVLRSACAVTLARSNDRSVYPMLETLAKKADEKAIVRAACVAGIAGIKGDDAITELVEMLKVEKNNAVRAQIEDSLTGMKSTQRVTIAVSPLLRDDAAGSSAIRILGAVGGTGVIPPLAKELAEGKASSRRAVIRALGAILHPDAAKALVAFYPKANDAEKVDILSAFANHPYSEAVALMIGELENPKTYPAVRRRAALTLGALRAPAGIKPLVKALLNTVEQDGLRITCAQALGEYGDHDDQAIAGLIGALADKKIAEEASFSLSRVTKRYFGVDKQKWTEWFQQWRQERDRGQGIRG